MLNDVIFNDGDKSAYLDWNIVLTKAEIPLPKIKSSTVDIMGADGVLDLSEILTGDVKYETRTAKLTFELMDDTRYTETITEISNYLHGKMVTFTLENDEDFYYKGRASINSWECSRRKGKIVITVDCEPYKLEVNETVIILPLTSTPTHYILQNLRKKICPLIDVTGDVVIDFNGHMYELSSGTHRIANIQLVEGDNRLIISGSGIGSGESARLNTIVLGETKLNSGSGGGSGSGTVKFTYRRGAL